MRSFLSLILVLPLAGCAAILGSKQKDFNLNSAPPAADVYLNGNRLGRTPVRVKLSNQATHTFVFRKEGYSEATCTLNRGTGAGWVILDVLTGLVPVIIDAATNSWSQTKGDGCLQSLEPLDPAAPPVAHAPSPAQDQARPPSEAPRRPELVDDVPSGTNWVANARTRTYYRVGCPVTLNIPRADRLYYGGESGLKTAGFTMSEECSAPGPGPLPQNPSPSDTSRRILPLPMPPTPATPDRSSGTLLPPENSSAKGTRHSRAGFWFNGGLGYGSLGCQNNCDSRVGGLSGGLAFGGTLSQKVVLGVGTNGWYKSENGVTLSVGTLAALIRFYPSATGGFFLLGGLGVGSIRAEVSGFGSATETGAGALLGLGYDIRVGSSVSLTPFWNGFAIKTSDDDANVGQIGLSVTAH